MKLFSLLLVAVLAGALMAGCADKDSHPEPHGVYNFEAENVIRIHVIDSFINHLRSVEE